MLATYSKTEQLIWPDKIYEMMFGYQNRKAQKTFGNTSK